MLGIDVDDGTLGRWAGWLAPSAQPFFVESAAGWPSTPGHEKLSPELRDTFRVWRMTGGRERVWLDEHAFGSMPRRDRARLVRMQVDANRGAVPTVRGWADVVDRDEARLQADGHRFVWWPSMLGAAAGAVAVRAVTSDGLLPSRHRDVTRATWLRCAPVLPGARAIAGTFAEGSGPNCFATVMHAAGAEGVPVHWDTVEPFESWLGAACRPGGDDAHAGSVLVWRDGSGQPVHAAVTLGDGWALEKAAQTWWSPREVLAVADVVRTNRVRGQRLERPRLAAG